MPLDKGSQKKGICWSFCKHTVERERASERARAMPFTLWALYSTLYSMRASKCTLCLHFSVHKDKFACECCFQSLLPWCQTVKKCCWLMATCSREKPLGRVRGGEGDIENEDSVYMIQHQDRLGIVGEKSQMVTWTLNELTFEQLRHATLRWFIVWQPRDFSLAALRDVLNTWTPQCI